VRKFLGALVAAVALCAVSFAQAAAQAPATDSTQPPASTAQPAPADSTQAATPVPAQPEENIPSPGKQQAAPKFPRTELFGGYSFAQAGFFNAGHWAQLNGWNGSFTINADKMIGVVFDGGEFFGNSKIPGAVPAPFPQSQSPYCTGPACTFNATTREYHVLFGAQFAYRKHERLTPFGEVMVGHASIRGQALGAGDFLQSEVSGGIALVAGAGVDRKINERFALRVKADYFQTRTDYPSIGKAKQDNLRLSVGIVVRSVHKKKRTLEEETGVEQ